MQNNLPIPKKWILIRGLMRSQYHWKNFDETLKGKLQAEIVQSVELPGNGILFHEKTPIEIDQAVRKMKSQVAEIDQQTYGIIGISLGGVLAARWAQLYPKEVSHLVLINSSSVLSSFYKRLLPHNYMAIIRHLIFSGPAAIEEFILQTTSNNEKIWRAHLNENIGFLRQHPLKLMNFLRQLKLSGQTDFTTVPAAKKLILTSKADRLVSYKCSEKIAQQWKCKIFYHEIAGHDLPLDDADWVIEKIQIFKS